MSCSVGLAHCVPGMDHVRGESLRGRRKMAGSEWHQPAARLCPKSDGGWVQDADWDLGHFRASYFANLDLCNEKKLFVSVHHTTLLHYKYGQHLYQHYHFQVPIHEWTHEQQYVLTFIFLYWFFTVCIILITGRLLCLACELWCIQRHIRSLLLEDTFEVKAQGSHDDDVASSSSTRNPSKVKAN